MTGVRETRSDAGSREAQPSAAATADVGPIESPAPSIVAYVDGAFGGLRLEINPELTPQMMADRGLVDEKTRREMKRRGWIR